MKKNILFGILSVILLSCSDNNENETPNQTKCKLISAKILTFYYDDITFSDDFFNHDFSGKIKFEYDNQNRIKVVKGGLVNILNANNLNNWVLSDEAQDLITYESNKITVEHSYNQDAKPYIKEFVISNEQLISRNVKNLYPFALTPIVYTYEYSGNQIIEKVNSAVHRTLTLSEGNLIRIEQIKYSFPDNEIVGKKEILFLGYDRSDNLLKDKFFVNGAFFKAFSKNNYTELQINIYDFKNNKYSLIDQSSSSFKISYDSKNTADLFETECQ